MKFLIKFTFQQRTGEIAEGEMRVWAEDVRYALRLCESDLDVIGAKVESVTPIPEPNDKVSELRESKKSNL